MASANPYQKLPGSGGAALQRCRLWLGPDHLLLVASSVIGERYKRFYFADIQALVVRPTAGYLVWSIVWALFVALFAWIGLVVEDEAGRYVLWGIAGFFLFFLILHLSFGPTCSCHVKTAVQYEPLPALRRTRTARKVLARVRPLIEAAQTSPAPVSPQA